MTSEPGSPEERVGEEVLRRRDGRGHWPFFAAEAEPLAEAMAARGVFALEVPGDVATSGRAPVRQGFGDRISVDWRPDGTMAGRVVSSSYAAATRFEGRLEPGPTADTSVLRGTMRNATHRVYAWLLYPGAALLVVVGLLAASSGEVGIALLAVGVALGLGWFARSTRSDSSDSMAVDLISLGNALWSAGEDPVVPGTLTSYEPSEADVALLREAVVRLERSAGTPAYDALERDNHPVTNAELADLLRDSAAGRTFTPELLAVADEVVQRLR